MNQNKKLFLFLIIGMLVGISGMYLFNNYKIEKKNSSHITTPTDCFNCTDSKNSQQNESPYTTTLPDSKSVADDIKLDENFEILPEENIEQLTEENTVISYIKQNHELPDFYITKSEARKAGWNPSNGNLCDAVPGKAIGGDRFSNREKKLPTGTQYFEADVNYKCGHRQADRIVFTKKGDVWVTHDHYKNFEKR